MEKLTNILNNKSSVKTARKSKAKTTRTGNKLLSSMSEESNITETQNGAKTFKSTNSELLDLFSRGAAMRSASVIDIESLISAAWASDKLNTMKTIFYIRNIRGLGQGERRFFRIAIAWLAQNERTSLHKNLEHIATFGRWDDVVSLLNTPAKQKVLDLIKSQITKDVENYDKGNFAELSLLCKWLPSENASSKNTKMYGKVVREFLNLSPRNYRVLLSSMRSKLNIVEKNMTSNTWNEINYSAVPSRASSIYSKAFRRHDAERYQTFLDAVKSGDAKINASALYPYDLVYKAMTNNDATVDAQWAALPNYCDGSDKNVLVVVDTSGSMSSYISTTSKVSCLHVAISMGIYFGERIGGDFKNHFITVSSNPTLQKTQGAISMGIHLGERIGGDFKNHFITFSSNPTLQKIQGNDLKSKVHNLSKARWTQSTNLQAVFDLVLNHAIKNRVSQSDMPNTILIVSDMEFNDCSSNTTNYQAITQKYSNAGYEMPKIVFWNVQAKTKQSPVTKDQNGVALVSGCSPSTFNYVTSGISKTPYETMMDVLNNEIFHCVKV